MSEAIIHIESKELEYEEAPSGAIKLYNYKEPLMPVPKGCHGFMGVLLHDAQEDLVQCHYCGEWQKSLARHIHKHGYANVKQYKQEFGLSNSTALVSEGLRQSLVERGLKLAEQFKLNATSAPKGHKRTKGIKSTVEQRNNRGTCHLQLLDKLDQIATEIGHHPTKAEVKALTTLNGKPFSGAGLYQSLKVFFGSWNNAIKELHWSDVIQDKFNKPKRYWSKERLLIALEDFIRTNSRFPTRSDHKRGILPSAFHYHKEFGGIKKANEQLLLSKLKQ